MSFLLCLPAETQLGICYHLQEYVETKEQSSLFLDLPLPTLSIAHF